MEVALLGPLLGFYFAIGLTAGRYSATTRALLVGGIAAVIGLYFTVFW